MLLRGRLLTGACAGTGVFAQVADQLSFIHLEGDVDRVHAGQRRQRAAGWLDQVANTEVGFADVTAERGINTGVAKIQLGRFKVCLGQLDGCCRLSLGADLVVVVGLADGAALDQVLSTGEIFTGIDQTGLAAAQLCLGAFQGRFKGRAVNFVKQLTLLNRAAFIEVALDQKALNTSLDIDRIDRF